MANKTLVVQEEYEEDETSYMTTEVAEKLDRMIRDTADALQDAHDEVEAQWIELKRLVAEAKSGKIHEMLGFKSWPEYLINVVGFEQISKDSEIERIKLIEFLVSEGMSQRAIARALKIGVATVNRAVDQLLHEGLEVVVAMGLDGKVRPKQKTGLEKKRDSVELTPQLHYQKVYNEIGEGISVLIHRVSQDTEFTAVAKQELDHLVELRNELSKAIASIRRYKPEIEA